MSEVHIIQDVLCYTADVGLKGEKEETPALDALFAVCKKCITTDCLPAHTRQRDAATDHILKSFSRCTQVNYTPWKRFMILCGLAWSRSFRKYCQERTPIHLRRGQEMVWLRLPKMLQAFAENKPIPHVRAQCPSIRDFVLHVCLYMNSVA